MTVRTNAGTRFFIGPANEVADDQSEYEALSYIEVGEIEDFGSFGDQMSTTTFVAVGDERERNIKTIKRGVAQQLVIGLDEDDSGQTALEAAIVSKSNFAIKMVFDDGSDGSPSSGTTYYFRALVTDGMINLGNAENVKRRNITIMKNSDTVKVAAV